MRDKLKQISVTLTRMHKALLDSQFAALEKETGQQLSPGKKLNLLLNGEEYQWLRPLSQTITTIDEVIFQKEDVTVTQSTSLITIVQDLFISESEFLNRYLQVSRLIPDLDGLDQKLKSLLN